MNTLNEIHLKNGHTGKVDLIDRNGQKQIRFSTIDKSGVGVHTVWINVPSDTVLLINDFPKEDG